MHEILEISDTEYEYNQTVDAGWALMYVGGADTWKYPKDTEVFEVYVRWKWMLHKDQNDKDQNNEAKPTTGGYETTKDNWRQHACGIRRWRP